jgi:formyl-CoA transferase
LKVLDVASFIAAPVAATVMADYGADVIKVEPPGAGDPNRTVHNLASYPKANVNYPWEMDSRGKRSVVLDLARPEGQKVLYRLAERADVLVTNYPLEVRKRLKIGYETIAPLNPRLIYASFTGYGERGPDVNQVGFDSTAYFARSGLFDSNRYEGQPPGVAMPAQGDRGSGISLFAAIMLALFSRAQTGKGTLVTSSLLANGLWANGVGAQAALLGGFLGPRPPRERPRNALTNPYETADGRWLQLTIVREDRDWGPFCHLIGKPELEHDPRFDVLEKRRARASELFLILDPIFRAESWPVWRDRFLKAGIPVGLIGRLQDLASDEQAVACGAVVETANPIMPLTLAAPFGLASAPVPPATRAPGLGEHADAILGEAGLTASEIAALRGDGILG